MMKNEIRVSVTETEQFKTICVVAMMAIAALRCYANSDDGATAKIAKEAIVQIDSELAAINIEPSDHAD